MRKHQILGLFLAASLLAPQMVQAAPQRDEFRRALSLYNKGMYEQARGMFESVAAVKDDPLSEGYAVLCAVQMRSDGYENLVDAYDSKYPESILRSPIHYQNALILFDKEFYDRAAAEFSAVNEKDLFREDLAEYVFKKAYADFGCGKYSEAKAGFARVENMPYSDYTAPARYTTGYMLYMEKDFDAAFKCFSKSVKDHRFEEMSSYYMLECRFMNKDYRFVSENGPSMFEKVPQERKPHLARIISESYLVLGDASKAKEYYENANSGKNLSDRKDYFYAGSVLYAVKDWQGAVDNFSQMADRSDSLGQAANYDMAYSYIQLKNKVKALEAFKDAASANYNAEIKEDAWFNWAKLSFDINNDASVFADYIAKYSNRKRGDEIYNYMALACLSSHDYAGAVEAYDKIADLDDSMKNNYMKANYLRAHELIGNGSWKDARQNLVSASYYGEKYDAFNQLARFWLAESEFRTGKYLEAQDKFTSLYNLAALDGNQEGKLLPFNIAYCAYKAEDYGKAAKWFDEYLASGDETAAKEAGLRRADCDFARRDYESAALNYGKVVDRFGSEGDLYANYQMGISYGLKGNVNAKINALSCVQDASSETPYYSESLYELGRAYVSAGNSDNALRCFKALRASSSDQTYVAQALMEMGMIYNNDGQPGMAIDSYKAVVSGMPGTQYAQNALASIESIYQAEGNGEKYIAYAESIGANAGKTEAEKEEMYFTAAESAYLNGNWEKTISLMNDCISRYPSGKYKVKAGFYVAESLYRLGRKDEACDKYASVVASGSKEPFMETAYLDYAELSYGMQRWQDAYKSYSNLLASASFDENKAAAEKGMMWSAYKAKDWKNASTAADVVKKSKRSSADLVRSADYVKAKSLLAMSKRSEAYDILRHLAQYPSTAEGAEAQYLIIQDTYDKADFEAVKPMVLDFAGKCGNQRYWLAKAFIVLGDSFVELDNMTQAKATLESLKNGYSPAEGTTDDIADNVSMRLARIQELISK